ncbi:phage portal protein, partial [Klebsiella michiganensis]
MWGSGVEQMLIGFLTFSLRPWLTRIEQAIRKSLLAPGERNKYFAEFSIEGLLRADSAARAAFYSTMTQNGLMTRNEAR